MMNSRQHAADPAEHGLVADLRPGHARTRTCPGFVVLCPGKPVVGPQLWSNSFLPGIYQGTHINNSRSTRKTIIRDVAQPLPLAGRPARSSSTCCSELNQLHLAERGRRRPARSPHRSRWRWPSACRSRRRKRSTSAARPQRTREPLRRRRVRRRLPARPPAGRARRARGADLLRQRPAVGRPQRHQQPPRPRRSKSDQPIAALLTDLKARGLLRRHAGALGRRVRPHADRPKAPRAATTTPRLHACGWPAAASRAAWPTARPTSSAIDAVENRVHVHDLHATILHLMGLDHEQLTYRYSGRDFRLTDVHGRVVQDILA